MERVLVHCAVKTDYSISFHAGLEKYIFLLLSTKGSLMNNNCFYSIVFYVLMCFIRFVGAVTFCLFCLFI